MQTPSRPIYDVTLRDLVTGRHIYRCRVHADAREHALRKARTWAQLAGIPESARLDAHIELLTPAAIAEPHVSIQEVTEEDFRQACVDSAFGDLEHALEEQGAALERLRTLLARPTVAAQPAAAR